MTSMRICHGRSSSALAGQLLALVAFMLLAPSVVTLTGQSVSWASTSTLGLPSDVEAGGSLEIELLQDAADGKLDQFTLWEAALIADAAGDEQTLGRLAAELDLLSTQTRELVTTSSDNLMAAERLYTRIHQHVLRGQYHTHCSLRETLESGNYNCLTATILYYGLCQRHHVPCQAVATPGHVYCRVDSQHPMNVETTAPTWADATRSSTMRGQAAAARGLTAVQLVGKIYYNRGSALLERSQYAAALAVLERSLQLDAAHDAAQTNLLATINNWALAYCDRGEFAQAAALVAHGLSLCPDYGPLRTNDTYVHHHWVTSLCRQQRYDEALAVLWEARRRPTTTSMLPASQATVYRAWISTLLETADWPEADRRLEQSWRDHQKSPLLAEWHREVVSELAVQLQARNEYQRAEMLLKANRD